MKFSYCTTSWRSFKQSRESEISKTWSLNFVESLRRRCRVSSVTYNCGKKVMSIVARLTAKKKMPSASHRKFRFKNWAMNSEIVVSDLNLKGWHEFFKSNLAQDMCQESSCEREENKGITPSVQSSTNGSARVGFAPFASQVLTRSASAVSWNWFKICRSVLAPCSKERSSAMWILGSIDNVTSEDPCFSKAEWWSVRMCSNMVVWLDEPKYPGFG